MAIDYLIINQGGHPVYHDESNPTAYDAATQIHAIGMQMRSSMGQTDTAFRVIKTNRTTAVAQMIDGYQIIVVADYDESTSLLQALGALAARILRLMLGSEEYADKVHSNKNLFAHIGRVKPLLSAAAKLSRSQQSFLVQATDRVLLTGPLGEDNRQTLRGRLARGCARSAPNAFHAFLFARGKLAASWARDPDKEGGVLPSDLILLNLVRCAVKREARSAARVKRAAQRKTAARDKRRGRRRRRRQDRSSGADGGGSGGGSTAEAEPIEGQVNTGLYGALLDREGSKLSEASRAMLLKMQERRRQREEKASRAAEPEPEPEPEPTTEVEVASGEPSGAVAQAVDLEENGNGVGEEEQSLHSDDDDDDLASSDSDDDGTIAGGGSSSSSDDGWESEDEDDLLLAAAAAAGGMISPSVSNDSLTALTAAADGGEGEDIESPLSDSVSRAPVMRRLHLQLRASATATTPCDVVFGDGGANMSLILVFKAVQMTGVTPRGRRRARRTTAELQAEAEQLEGMIGGVRKQLQLSGLCEYVDVRARDHVNMKYYLPRFPGLVHFIFVDVEACEFLSPRLSSLTAASLKGSSAEARALSDLVREVWRAVAEARDAAVHGYPLIMSKHGDLQYASRCWTENAAGEEIVGPNEATTAADAAAKAAPISSSSSAAAGGGAGAAALPLARSTSSSAAAATAAAGGAAWMRSFWRIGGLSGASVGRSYQLYSIHLASLPAAAIADTMNRLVAECRDLVQSRTGEGILRV